MRKTSLFDQVGGLPTLERVHKIFYDKAFAHPWLGKYFEGHSQAFLERRQTEFMAEKMGGPVEYRGRDPYLAHRAMYIPPELFRLRSRLLEEALEEAGVPEALRRRWLRIDNAFHRQIVNPSVADFYSRTWKYELRVIHPCPEGLSEDGEPPLDSPRLKAD